MVYPRTDRSDAAFDLLLEKVQAECTLDTDAYDAQYAEAAETIAAQVLDPAPCVITIDGAPTEPTTPMLIDSVGNTTLQLLANAAVVINDALDTDGCYEEDGSVAAPSSERVEALRLELTRLGHSTVSVGYDEFVASGWNFIDHEKNNDLMMSIAFTLPTVYHKLVPPCAGSAPSCAEPGGVLTQEEASVFDIATWADGAKCSGEPCKAHRARRSNKGAARTAVSLFICALPPHPLRAGGGGGGARLSAHAARHHAAAPDDHRDVLRDLATGRLGDDAGGDGHCQAALVRGR